MEWEVEGRLKKHLEIRISEGGNVDGIHNSFLLKCL